MGRLDESRSLLPNWVVPVICLLLLVMVGLVVVVFLAVGISYHPELTATYLATGGGLAIAMLGIAWLAILRMWKGGFSKMQKSLARILGGLLSVFGAYWMIADQGDWFLYFWVFLLGIALFLLAAGGRNR